jgi:hypothetical protein
MARLQLGLNENRLWTTSCGLVGKVTLGKDAEKATRFTVVEVVDGDTLDGRR